MYTYKRIRKKYSLWISAVSGSRKNIYKRIRKKYFIWTATAAAAILIVFVVFFVTSHLSLQKNLRIPGDSYILSIEKGDTLIGVLSRLHRENITDSPGEIRLWMRIVGLPSVIQAGNYRLQEGMTQRELLHQLVVGQQVLYSVRADTGATYKDFYAAVRNHPQVLGTLEGKPGAEVMELLGSEYAHPEGMFYADTYGFYKGETDLNILKRAHNKLNKILLEEWEARAADLPYQTPYEALILASIVEKETGLDSERPVIAGVFVNRLRKGMRLQTDPTVIYGMGDAYKGNIRRRDLRQPTPYNTYVIYGLPPTPIALTDRRAIRAVMQPADTDYLFFVAKGGGERGHSFSVTLEQHNRAVRKYQLRQ